MSSEYYEVYVKGKKEDYYALLNVYGYGYSIIMEKLKVNPKTVTFKKRGLDTREGINFSYKNKDYMIVKIYS